MAGAARKPEAGQIALLRRLFLESGLAHWRGYAVALTFMAITAGMTGLSAWIMKDVVNEIFVGRDGAMVPVIAGAVAAIFIVKGIASYVQQVLLSRIGNSIVADIQIRLFDHIQRHRIDFYDRHTVGQLNMRFAQGAHSAREAINAVVTSMGRDFFTLIALFTGALWGQPMWGTWWEWDPRLTSFLVLFLFYLGYSALWAAIDDPDTAADLTSVLCLVGSVFALLSRYALLFWNQGLHQGASLSLDAEENVADVFWYPLLVCIAGFVCLFVALVLVRTRTEIRARRMRALIAREGLAA